MDLEFKKRQLLYFPVLYLSGLFILGYSLIHWFLLQLFNVDEDLGYFWLPLLLPGGLLFFFLRPRLKLLNFTGSHSRFIYLLIASIYIAVPTIIAQAYLKTVTGKLTQLDSIQEIMQHPPTQFYQLKRSYIDKTQIGLQRSFEVTGRSNNRLTIKLYIAIPIFASEADSHRAPALAWYGKIYQEEISNRLEPDEKEAQFQAFLTRIQTEFDEFDPHAFNYLDRLGPSSLYSDLLSAAQNSPSYQAEYRTIFMPAFTPFEARNGHKLAWIIGWLLVGALVWYVMLRRVKLDEVALNSGALAKQLDHRNTTSELQSWLEFIRPKAGFMVTPVLMSLNAFVFIFMAWSSSHVIHFQSHFLLEWGANFRPNVLAGEWWRLVTSSFIHGGLAHLVLNLYGLFFVSTFIEPLLGKWRLLLVYLVSGILASVASLCWYDATISVGASGAIMGLFGILVIWVWKRVFAKEIHFILSINVAIFVTASVVSGFLGGVDNAAHIGGFVSGLLLGFLLLPYIRKPQPTKKQKPRRK